jgi:hypothetical protein
MNPRTKITQLAKVEKPGGYGLVRGADPSFMTDGELSTGSLQSGLRGHDGDLRSKTAVAMPQGYSRGPNPSTEQQ